MRIAGLGDTAAGIVVAGWSGDGFHPAFLQQLAGLAGPVAHADERHLAYPVGPLGTETNVVRTESSVRSASTSTGSA